MIGIEETAVEGAPEKSPTAFVSSALSRDDFLLLLQKKSFFFRKSVSKKL